ncbi:hypothetical protein PV392_07330 [Streptomyces sp. ME03-5709C]|nr:hypothetical protein [Streptomyces sp. ME03-5709C]
MPGVRPGSGLGLGCGVPPAVVQLKAAANEVRDEDIGRLSPLGHRNLNPLGRRSSAAGVPPPGNLRPLRDQDVPELDEDDCGEDGR